MVTCFISHYDSPLGGMIMASNGIALTALKFEGRTSASYFTAERISGDSVLPVFEEVRQWLDMYFAGEKPDFTPPLAPQGTPFRKRVWSILLTIPYGKTMSYGNLARCVSPTMSAQAIGGAVGHNPIGIIIPCHRVIGADGSLTGYGGGLDRKRWLLELEMK